MGIDMVFFETGSSDPYYNLAFEEYIFEKKEKDKQYFILWQNNNAVIVGKYQNTIEEINNRFVDEHNIKVVRRNSGGGAVYHDMGNLNFSFIVDQNDYELLNFSLFLQPVIKTLFKLGIRAEFSGRNDILIEEKKFSGNSQYIKDGKVLHHGTIMLNSNIDMIKGALNPTKHVVSRSTKSVRSHVTNVFSHMKQKISVLEFKEILRSEISNGRNTEMGKLSEDDILAINELRTSKYESWEWNYGHSTEFNLKKERQFPSGNISIYILSKEGRILSASIKGDFFAYTDISVLEKNLKGAPVGSGLREWLVYIDADKYIKGISVDDLYRLILY